MSFRLELLCVVKAFGDESVVYYSDLFFNLFDGRGRFNRYVFLKKRRKNALYFPRDYCGSVTFQWLLDLKRIRRMIERRL